MFALIGNPHHSLSMLIPDSIKPWVYVSPWEQLQRGYQSRALTRSIPKEASVSAETQLIPMLAERRVLLRYPFNYRYTDEQGQAHDVEWIVLQPRFKATYAPAFRRQANTLEHGMNPATCLRAAAMRSPAAARAASCSSTAAQRQRVT